MLVEAWISANDANLVIAFLPANADNFPGCCYRISDADWRYMERFLAQRSGKTVSGRTFRQFKLADARPFLAAAEPYLPEKSNAG